MTFSRWEMLFLLWAVPVLAAFFWRAGARRRRILARFADGGSLPGLLPERRGRREILRQGFLLAALACLAFALSGARYGYVWEKVEKRGVSLIIALDVSKSMLAGDAAPSRLAQAKREVFDLLAMLQGDQVGLVAFAGTAFLSCPLTVDYGAFDLFLGALTPENLPVGGTDLAGAVEASLSAFGQGNGSDKAIILISDGEGADPKAALNAAREAAKAGVKIFSLGVGTPEGAPIPEKGGGFTKDNAGAIVHSRLDEPILQEMAAATGGVYARSAPGDADLDAIYREGVRAGMRAGATGESRIQVYRDRFQWFLGAAVFFLALHLFLPAAGRRRAPLIGALVAFMVGAGLLFGADPALAGASGESAKGLQAYAAGDYAQARERFLAAQTLAPDSPQAAYDAGCAAYRLGLFDEAERFFSLAAKAVRPARPAAKGEDPELEGKALYNQGNALFRLEKLPEAVKAYEEALKAAPNDPEARANLDYVRRLLEKERQEKNKEDQDKGGEQEQKDKGGGEKKQTNQGKSENQDKSGQSGQSGQSGRNYEDKAPAGGLGKPPETPEKAPSRAEENAPQRPGGIDENMLNRLKDLPGMPAPPRYGRPPVEKDW